MGGGAAPAQQMLCGGVANADDGDGDFVRVLPTGERKERACFLVAHDTGQGTRALHRQRLVHKLQNARSCARKGAGRGDKAEPNSVSRVREASGMRLV